MTDLAEWLLASYDEDEKLARAATAGPWEPISDYAPWDWFNVRSTASDTALSNCTEGCGPRGSLSGADARHIARWDPVAVLADLAAKRRIVEQYRAAVVARSKETGYEENFRRAGSCDALEQVVRLLALPLASREGYDESWTPDA